jgi:UDP-N-acetylmuramoyl-tripeptide--D-alanyl-D-alanine ligase
MTVRFDAAGIAAATGGQVVRDAPAGPISTDTRALPQGAWFVALRGLRFDAHNFLKLAAENGAAGFVVERVEPDLPAGGVVKVEDTTDALQALGLAARKAFAGPVVGLTGSSGKTTTRSLISLALSPLGPIHQTVGNLNNHIGVPLTLLARPDDAAAMVVEMGTSGPGEIELLAKCAVPDVRLIVNVGPAHLEELGGLDGVGVEKTALFRTALPGHTVCVNSDDPRIYGSQIPDGVRRLTWGTSGDIALLEAEVDGGTLSTVATWATPQGKLKARIPAPGRHIAHNAAGALCVALALGIDLNDAVAALERYEPVGMRLRAEELPGGGRALNDAYNANPASMEASLRLVASLPGRKAVVIGDMLELGSGEHDWHVKIVGLAGELGFDRVVLLGPRMVAAKAAHPGALAYEEPEGAIGAIREWSKGPGDVVLFKGSRGARVERVLQGLQGKAEAGGH